MVSSGLNLGRSLLPFILEQTKLFATTSNNKIHGVQYDVVFYLVFMVSNAASILSSRVMFFSEHCLAKPSIGWITPCSVNAAYPLFGPVRFFRPQTGAGAQSGSLPDKAELHRLIRV